VRVFRLLYLEDVGPVDRPPLVVVGPGLAGEALAAPAAVAGSHALVAFAWPDQFLAGIFWAVEGFHLCVSLCRFRRVTDPLSFRPDKFPVTLTSSPLWSRRIRAIGPLVPFVPAILPFGISYLLIYP